MKIKFLTSIASATLWFCAVEAHAQANELPDISVTNVTMSADGGCTFGLTMTNALESTIQVRGQAYLVTQDGVTLGDSYVRFPPTIPRGEARTDVQFRSRDLAGGRCVMPSTLTVTTTSCRLVDESRYLRDRYCVVSYDFSLNRRNSER